ncbi:MAG: hypothetical protein E7256_14910 [Lachnospiraceae bacterium]|nr:hypothetical protein [Lachnospiraceae bacterium]
MAINTTYKNYTSSLLTAGSSGSSAVGQFMSIRSGSYKKLLKSYYAKQEEEDREETSTKQEYLTAKQDADSLYKASTALNLASLFEKKQNAETGEYEYDRDAIYNAVKAFADAYNDTLDSSSSQDDISVLRKAAMMTSGTGANKNLLSQVGITVGSDNKLTIDENALKNADISTLKTLFSGNNSLAAKTASKASGISSSAALAASNGRLYGSSGKYSASYAGTYVNSRL